MSCRSSPTRTWTRGAPVRPCSSRSQPARVSTDWRPAASPVKFAIVPPVTNPTSLPDGRPSRSSSQAAATSSTATTPGVAWRRAVFWSQALVSQSAAIAAGWVPPMTQPKNRPDGIPTSPGSIPAASWSTTVSGAVGPAGRGPPSTAARVSASARAGIGRSCRDVNHSRASCVARSSAGANTGHRAVIRLTLPPSGRAGHAGRGRSSPGRFVRAVGGIGGLRRRRHPDGRVPTMTP